MIQDEINRIASGKTSIRNAIIAQGVEVPSGATIDTYGTYIASISGGGGGGGEVENQIVAMEGEEYMNDIQQSYIPIGIAYTNNGDYTHLWWYEFDGGLPTHGEMPTDPMVYNSIKEDVLNHGLVITRMDDGLGSFCMSTVLDGFDYKDIVYFMGTTNSLSDIYTVYGVYGHGEEEEEPIE